MIGNIYRSSSFGVENLGFPNLISNHRYLPPLTHLGDAEKLRVGPGVVEAKRNGSCFVRVEHEPLEFVRRAARLYLTEETSSVEHVKEAGPVRSAVESNVHTDNILGFVEGVLDAAYSVSVGKPTPARPARVGLETVVSSVFGRASVRAATRSRRSLVEPRGVNGHGSAFGGVDEVCCKIGREGGVARVLISCDGQPRKGADRDISFSRCGLLHLRSATCLGTYGIRSASTLDSYSRSPDLVVVE